MDSDEKKKPRHSLEALGLTGPVVESLEQALRYFRAARSAEAAAPKRRALSELHRKTKAIAEAATALEDALKRAGELDARLLKEIGKDFEELTRDEDETGSIVERSAVDAIVDAEAAGLSVDTRFVRAVGAFPVGQRLDGMRGGLNALERVARHRAHVYSKPKRRGPGKDQYRETFAVNIGLILERAGHRLTTTPKTETSKGGLFYRVARILFDEARELPPNAPLLWAAREAIRTGKTKRGRVVNLDGRTVFPSPSGRLSIGGHGPVAESLIQRAEEIFEARALGRKRVVK